MNYLRPPLTKTTYVDKKKWIPSYDGNLDVVFVAIAAISLWNVVVYILAMMGVVEPIHVTRPEKLGAAILLLFALIALVITINIYRPFSLTRGTKTVKKTERVKDPVEASPDAEIGNADFDQPTTRGKSSTVAASKDAPDAGSKLADGRQGRDDGSSSLPANKGAQSPRETEDA